MRLRWCTPRALALFAAALIAPALIAARRAGAQAVLGFGDDATLPGRGTVRLVLQPQWSHYDKRYGTSAGGSALRPLGAAFSFDTLGANQLEALSALQDSVRALAGNQSLALSLGRTRLLLDRSASALPLRLEYGVTDRLAVSVTMPFVRTRSEAVLNLDRAGGANVGLNPGLSNTTIGQFNAALFAQYASSVSALQSLLTTCADPNATDARCPTVRANQASLAALESSASALTGGLQDLFGKSPFVPIAGSAPDAAIRQRFATLVTSFNAIPSSLSIPTLPNVFPVSAAGGIGVDTLQALLADSRLGVGVEPLQSIVRLGIGDVEVAASLQFLNTRAGRDSGGAERRLSRPGPQLRSTLTAVVRLGTATTDTPENLLDVGGGDGQTDLEARSATDIVFGRRFWVSVVGRYTRQLPDRKTLRVAPPDAPFPAAFRRQIVDRDLGDYWSAEVTPRVVLSDYLSFGAQYYMRSKAADRYTGTFQVADLTSQPVTLDASVLDGRTSETESRVAIGVAYSTVAAVARRRARVPLEVSVLHAETIAGSGGAPRLRQSLVNLRVYMRVFGR